MIWVVYTTPKDTTLACWRYCLSNILQVKYQFIEISAAKLLRQDIFSYAINPNIGSLPMRFLPGYYSLFSLIEISPVRHDIFLHANTQILRFLSKIVSLGRVTRGSLELISLIKRDIPIICISTQSTSEGILNLIDPYTPVRVFFA